MIGVLTAAVFVIAWGVLWYLLGRIDVECKSIRAALDDLRREGSPSITMAKAELQGLLDAFLDIHRYHAGNTELTKRRAKVAIDKCQKLLGTNIEV